MVSVNQLGLFKVYYIMNKFGFFTFSHLFLAGSSAYHLLVSLLKLADTINFVLGYFLNYFIGIFLEF